MTTMRPVVFVALVLVPALVRADDKQDAADTARKWLEISKIPFTPEQLGFAIAACDVEKVKLFLAAGMDPNVKVSSIGSALDLAISKSRPENGNCTTTLGLLVRGGAEVGAEHLLEVAGSGNRSFVEIVLGQRVDKNAAAQDGSTAAVMAARTKSVAVMETLRDAGADLNKADKGGLTPLMHAVNLGDVDMVRFLVIASSGIDLARKDRFGRTALALARIQGQAHMNQPGPSADVIDTLAKAHAPE